MPHRKSDRRCARTRALLENSLLALIRRKAYDAITIQEICAGADVGRSTFYAYYRSKDDLKRHGLEHLRSELADAQSKSDEGARLSFSLPMFEHAHAHLEDYRALKRSRGGKVALGRIREILTERVREELATYGAAQSDMDAELTREYLVGAYLAVLTWWLDDGAREEPAVMDSMFRRLAQPTIDGAVSSRRDSWQANVRQRSKQ
jgi:AcrR family transcriptional regulator